PKANAPEPERFAMYHNGVTVYALSARTENGKLIVRQPSVLNGCQTVKNAYFFLNDTKVRDRIDKELWDRIAVPLRVVVTSNPDLVRQVAVSNNRQTAIR